ncbi:hypothetical protein AMTRI_Chr02g223650 [Amborella trichopoda]
MFGSTNPFGQSSSSPFGSPSVFGQPTNANNNPFAPKPFGSPTPFGSQTGSSIFGGTSTGVFGATQPSSPLGSTPAFGASSTPAFGASSTPAFGSSTPAFGATSTPAFGAGSSSAFGGSSIFGQKPAFGGFGSSPSQTSPFGGAFQQTQPAFGSTLFGSTSPFGASSQPAFGATSTPGFGSTTTPAFGSTTTPAFGASSTPAFGVSSSPAFGASSAPAFGASSTPVFGGSSIPAFGTSSTPAFGASSTPAFGASSTPAFGASSTPSFGFGSTPAFGQTTSTFGSAPFGTTPTSFGAQSSPFGAQTSTPTFGSPGFGQTAFGGQRGGSRVAPYVPTPEVDGGVAGAAPGKLESISAMPVYKDKSHEELRWEDYQLGDKGGPSPAGQPAGGLFGQPSQPSPFGGGAFGQTAPNPFSSSTSSNIFAPKTHSFGTTGFGAPSTSAFSSPFGASSSSPFGSTSSAPSLFGSSTTPAFGATSSPFNVSSTPGFGSSSPSIFGSAPASGSTPGFGSGMNFGNTQSSGLFSSTPSFGQTTPGAFGQQPTPGFGQTASTFGQTTGFGQSSPAFGQANLFGAPSTGFGGGLFSGSTPPMLSKRGGFGQTTPSIFGGVQPSAPAQTSGAFSFGNFGQTQPAASSGFGAVSNTFGQSTLGQPAATQSVMVMQPVPVTNPFGTLPAMPQMSIGRSGSAPSVQYGISSMPQVADKPIPVRISSLLTSRHVSQRSRINLQSRRYHPKKDGPMVSYFSDSEETPSTPKADALFVPRENPRALFIHPTEQFPSNRYSQKNMLKDSPNGKIPDEGPSAPHLEESPIQDNGKASAENGTDGGEPSFPSSPYQNGHHDEIRNNKATTTNGYISISGHRAGEAAIAYEHGADIEALMPKLRHPDYYTEPKIQELAAKERAEPGFCRKVKDFVVGRKGYGWIRFFGETDVRGLDLESIVQFNKCEVVVYMDESKKPPVGLGLNKPAEITLLNVRCMDKKTGRQFTEGPEIEKYKKMLAKKTEEQGAEFVTFDAEKGEWKFRVKHFSRYSLCGDVEVEGYVWVVHNAEVRACVEDGLEMLAYLELEAEMLAVVKLGVDL